MTKKGRPAGKPGTGETGVAKVAPSAGPWSVPVMVDDIPEDGLHRAIAASAEECAAVAALAGVRELSGFTAEFDLARRGNGVFVTGRVRARVGQTCVVSLEPMETEVDEAVELMFAPAAEGAEAGSRVAEERHRKTADEPPEPLVGGTVDLGAVATEFLLLGIEPYPRKPGVEFTPPQVEDDTPHPFAALEALKKGPGGGKS